MIMILHLPRSLYSAPLTQKERKRSGYDRIRNNPGIDEVAVTWGEVVGTKTEPGMNCYALVGHSTSSPGKWTDDLNDDVAIA